MTPSLSRLYFSVICLTMSSTSWSVCILDCASNGVLSGTRNKPRNLYSKLLAEAVERKIIRGCWVITMQSFYIPIWRWSLLDVVGRCLKMGQSLVNWFGYSVVNWTGYSVVNWTEQSVEYWTEQSVEYWIGHSVCNCFFWAEAQRITGLRDIPWWFALALQ